VIFMSDWRRRRHGSKPSRVIMGKLKGHSGPTDSMVEQT
jgi:hypothetical protein